MWIFTNKGFYSVVEDKADSRRVVVRARSREHLESVVPPSRIIETTDTDYRYRAYMLKEEWKRIMLKLIDNIDYSNFKNSVPEGAYHNRLLEIWREMYQYQERACRIKNVVTYRKRKG